MPKIIRADVYPSCNDTRPRPLASVMGIASSCAWLRLGSGRLASNCDRQHTSCWLSLQSLAMKTSINLNACWSGKSISSSSRLVGPGDGPPGYPVGWFRVGPDAVYEILSKRINIIIIFTFHHFYMNVIWQKYIRYTPSIYLVYANGCLKPVIYPVHLHWRICSVSVTIRFGQVVYKEYNKYIP